MLINPYIEGTTPIIFKAANSIKAAKIAYDSVSQYFNNSINSFNFTLLKLKSESIDANNSKLHKFNLKQYGGNSSSKRFNATNFSHFVVNEHIGKNKQDITYKLKQYTGNIDNLDHLINNVIKIQTKFNNKKHNNVSDSAQSTDESESIKNLSGGNNITGDDNIQNDNNLSDDDDDISDGNNNLSGSNNLLSNNDHSDDNDHLDDNNIADTSSDSDSNEYKQDGGKHKSKSRSKSKSKYDDDDDDSSDSSDSSDTDDYIPKYNKPISYWYYYPSMYSLNRNLYLPTFVSPLSFPYVIDISYNTISNSIKTNNPSITKNPSITTNYKNK